MIVVQPVVGYHEVQPMANWNSIRSSVRGFARQHVVDHEVSQSEQPDAEPEDGFACRLLRWSRGVPASLDGAVEAVERGDAYGGHSQRLVEWARGPAVAARACARRRVRLQLEGQHLTA